MADAPQKCFCKSAEIRARTRCDGRVIHVMQCVECGREIRSVKKDYSANVAPFDEELNASIDKKWQEYFNARANEIKAKGDAWELQRGEWWERYQIYLKSNVWRSKSEYVKSKHNGVCQSCHQRPAEETHHTDYKYVDFTGREPFFTLIPLCGQCHEFITEKDREWRSR